MNANSRESRRREGSYKFSPIREHSRTFASIRGQQSFWIRNGANLLVQQVLRDVKEVTYSSIVHEREGCRRKAQLR